MKIVRLILISTFLLVYGWVVAQEETNSQIDSLSKDLINALKENDVVLCEQHLIQRADFEQIMKSYKAEMSEDAYQNSISKLDSLVEAEHQKWSNNFDKIRQKGQKKSIHWQNINYLSSDIKLVNSKRALGVSKKIAVVSVLFEDKNKAYEVDYECVELNGRWILSEKLKL